MCPKCNSKTCMCPPPTVAKKQPEPCDMIRSNMDGRMYEIQYSILPGGLVPKKG